MPNPRLEQVPESSFRKLDRLLADLAPPRSMRPIKLSVGDPEHAIPELLVPALVAHQAGFGKYSPIGGTPEFRSSAAGWCRRRYALPEGMLDAEQHVLPVAGLRESMFLMALVVLPEAKAGQRPLVAIPNPFYHAYAGAAIAFGGEPLFMPATRDTGFMPAFEDLDEATLSRIGAVYLCSPANPQGSDAGIDYLVHLIELARAFDFALLVDECYADIYTGAPPVGVLEACASLGGELRQVLAFHSLSKRSNVPGLRSGFVAGDADLLRRFRALRDYGGVAMPLPVQAASAALWADDEHARLSRSLYAPKFAIAERIFGNRFGFYQPDGGMFLWLEVGDCVDAARRLWIEAGVRVMPGRYMSHRDDDGRYPGEGFLRIALVPDLATTTEALERIANVL